ncbi:MAG: hypothetical protein IKI84_04020 [Clostridia bacterium]|nr:hypothetical protein [Clostridia bacterium]
MNSYRLNVSTPDGTVFEGETEKLLFRAHGGDMTVLKGHVPLMTTIRPGNVILTLPDGTVKNGYAENGIVSVGREGVIMLSDTFRWTEK